MQESARKDFRQLEESIGQIWEIAKERGLDPFPVNFHLVPAEIMYEFGAYGLPGRFSHWTHGKAFHEMKTMYDYGLSKIYELVINNNPAHAFLLENNGLLQNQLVAAHVLAHVDFFKHSIGFKNTNRGMIDTVALNAARIRGYEFKYGKKEVEEILDAVISIGSNIDKSSYLKDRYTQDVTQEAQLPKKSLARVSPYDDLLDIGVPKVPIVEQPDLIPQEDDEDLLGVIARNSKELKPWQRDLVWIVRQEMVYFLPQMMTKIMNEGWASYWHIDIIREMDNRGYLGPGAAVDYANMHSSVLVPSRRSINPYSAGFKIFEDLNKKHKGLYKPSDGRKLRNWLGEEVNYRHFEGNPDFDIFHIREVTPTDQSFLRNYLTHELVEDLDLFSYAARDGNWEVVEKDPQKVIDDLVASMTNFGQPVIRVAKGGVDYNRNGEFELKHSRDDERLLDVDYAKKTLKAVYKLWGRSVHLETETAEGGLVLTCAGGDSITEKKLIK